MSAIQDLKSVDTVKRQTQFPAEIRGSATAANGIGRIRLTRVADLSARTPELAIAGAVTTRDGWQRDWQASRFGIARVLLPGARCSAPAIQNAVVCSGYCCNFA